jgi:hypothetical protein
MRSPVPRIPFAGTLALLVGAAACSRDATNLNSTAGGAPMAVQVTSSGATGGAASMAGLLTGFSANDNGGPGFGDFGDGMGHHWRGWWGWTRVRDVDSLIVTVARVEVLAAVPDSEDAADSAADSASADSAGHHHGDRDWDRREFAWIQLALAGSGHLDLIHLPDSAAAGLSVATGTLPPGTYRHVRLFVTNPMIYFDTLIVTPAGDSLQPGVGYPVVLPSADSSGALYRTDDPFVVPAEGDTVQMIFDRDDTVRHIIITGDGRIIVPPVFRFHFFDRRGRHFGR